MGTRFFSYYKKYGYQTKIFGIVIAYAIWYNKVAKVLISLLLARLQNLLQ